MVRVLIPAPVRAVYPSPRAGRTAETAQEMYQLSGTRRGAVALFDPRVVAAFLAVRDMPGARDAAGAADAGFGLLPGFGPEPEVAHTDQRRRVGTRLPSPPTGPCPLPRA